MGTSDSVFRFKAWAWTMKIYYLVASPTYWLLTHIRQQWPEDGGSYQEWMDLNKKTSVEEFVTFATVEGLPVRQARKIADEVINGR